MPLTNRALVFLVLLLKKKKKILVPPLSTVICVINKEIYYMDYLKNLGLIMRKKFNIELFL